MHLVAERAIRLTTPLLPGPIPIEQGEHIQTEFLRKYTENDIYDFSEQVGLRVDSIHYDPKKWFAISELTTR